MKVALSLDDFSVVNNRLDLLLKLKAHYPDFKVSLFTVPVDEKKDWGISLIRDISLKEVKKHLDWIQIIPHGFTHEGREVARWSYRNTVDILYEIEKAFNRDGLPFVKGFKAPHWEWNEEVVEALDDEGWWGAIDPRQPKMFRPKRFYVYSHAIDNFPHDGDMLKLHGHIYGTRNDLGLCFDNILKLPLDTEWHFVTDFLGGE